MAAAKRRGVRIGRPRKLTDWQIDQSREKLAAGTATSAILAARFHGSPRTVYRIIK